MISRGLMAPASDRRGAYREIKALPDYSPLPINKQPSAGHLTSACFFARRWKDYRPPYKNVKLMKPNKSAKNIYFCFRTPASLSILTA